MPLRPPVHRPAHAPAGKARRDQLADLDQRRGSAASRGYDGQWRRVRLQHLADEPLCRFCLAANRVEPATDVDHIVPIALAPERRLDRSNLRSLCQPCHSRLTASGAQRRG